MLEGARDRFGRVVRYAVGRKERRDPDLCRKIGHACENSINFAAALSACALGWRQ